MWKIPSTSWPEPHLSDVVSPWELFSGAALLSLIAFSTPFFVVIALILGAIYWRGMREDRPA